MKVVQLSGGVGGARLARGFNALPEVEFTVVVNVGDDTRVHGLEVSPDIDTVVYNLAGMEGPYGWGRDKESFSFNEELERYGIDNTFRLGDRDLALKFARTLALGQGSTLSEFTSVVTEALAVRSTVIPATDDPLHTKVRLEDGWTTFFDYFVTRRYQDPALEVAFEGAEQAVPAPGVLSSIQHADMVVIGPSNPILSIWPILAIPGIKEALMDHRYVVGVSPLIGGMAVKGPAREVLISFGLTSDTNGVLASYRGLIQRMYVDPADNVDTDEAEIIPTDILLDTPAASARLAREIVGT